MYRIWFILHFIFTWGITSYVVFYFNIRLEDGGYNLNLFGVMFFIVLITIGYKTLNKKMNIWEIQSKNKALRAIIGSLKAMLFSGAIWWVWEALNNNYTNIHNTLMLVFFSIILGALCRFIGLAYQSKTKKETTIK